MLNATKVIKSKNTSTIVLVMIVKNEIGVIKRCFDSVKKYIDYWCIHDTGSTDGTQEFIKKYFDEAGIPGELINSEWINFGHNRTLAVKSAKNKADYCLLLDADFIFVLKDENFREKLTEANYQIKYEGGIDYRQSLLVKSCYDWRYVGVTHEFIISPEKFRAVNLDSFTINHFCDGGSRSDKFSRDIELLSKALKYLSLNNKINDKKLIEQILDNTKEIKISESEEKLLEEQEHSPIRYVFYLAQSYKDIAHYEDAIKWYEIRAEKGGWPEEVYFSMYQNGKCRILNNDKFENIQKVLLAAYNYRPSRLEALYTLLQYCNLNNLGDLSYFYSQKGIETPYPKTDILFIEKDIHEWKFLDECAIACELVGKFNESVKIYNKIFASGKLPGNFKKQFGKNYNIFKTKLLTQNNEKFLAEKRKNKVAIVIVNYNMTERADNIVEKLKKTVKHPHDIILVDNGSTYIRESKYTTLRLIENVQTTNGWLMGLDYADKLEKINKEEYFAYCFVITSCELCDEKQDIIAKMVNTMKADSDVVGVHPSLKRNSTTSWQHLFNSPGKKLESVRMIDNIFSCYRATWFNKIGRFDPNLTYAWGIDLETSYKARRDGKKILLDNTIQVVKETDIGYKMNRMGMTSDDRRKNASKEMNEVLKRKYGLKYNSLIWDNISKKEDYVKPPEKKVITVKDIKKGEICKIGFGKFLFKLSLLKKINLVGKTLVEIGCTRNNSGQDSTFHLGTFCQKNKLKFISVDMDADNIKQCAEKFNKYGLSGTFLVNTGEEFLERYNGTIDYLYLDGFDFYHSYHDEKRKEKYSSLLGKEITNDNCWKMHLDCVKLAYQKISKDGFICINNILEDKNFNGKGKTAIPFLNANGFHICSIENDSAILKKSIGNEYDITIVKPSNQKSPSNISIEKKKKNDFSRKFKVVLLGYKNTVHKHTNWYPWNRFYDVFKTLGYETDWLTLDELKNNNDTSYKRIFICWNQPTCLELIVSKCITKNDIILQKLTSLGKGMNGINWGNNPKKYFQKWSWPIHKTVEYLYSKGFNIYGFGCKTVSEPFPMKNQIMNKMKNRVFEITWGSTVYNKKEIDECKPVMTGFKYNIGYVGSLWGKDGRGNTDQWNNFLNPIIKKYENNALHGSGINSMISDDTVKKVLQSSKLCPIIHCPSWIAERGVQDRFYTVFISGRFGVVDNPGVYDLFDSDEVVCEMEPEKYIEKSDYYLKNVKEQFPFIEKVQNKIKTKYNFYKIWEQILIKITTDEYNIDDVDFNLLMKGDIVELKVPFLT